MDAPPRLRLTSVTIGAPDPLALADFYARLLGGEVTQADPPGPDGLVGWAQVRTDGPRVNVEHEAAWQRPQWPAEAGRPFATQHLDIEVDELEPAVRWALTCGATLADVQPQDDVRVLFDPAGHPFCLFV